MTEYHPELARARFIPRFKQRDWSVALLQRIEQKPPRTPDDIVIEEIAQEGARLRVYRPVAATGTTPALFWIHGGGYIQGSPIQDEGFAIAVARELGITVASIRYRLAPTHPSPAAVEDAYAALLWLANHAAERGVDPARIAIGGASAGGGLAAALVLYAHDRGEVHPVFQLLRYPMLDDRTVTRDLDDRKARLWTNQNNRYGWTAYLGQEPGGPGVSPYAAPARREDVTGLPPAWIGVGTLDLFHDEDLEYARRLREAGGEVSVDVVPGAFHGFDAVFFGKTGVVKDFQRAQIEALRAALR